MKFELRRSRPQCVAKIETAGAVIEHLPISAHTEAAKDCAEVGRFSKKLSGASK